MEVQLKKKLLMCYTSYTDHTLHTLQGSYFPTVQCIGALTPCTTMWGIWSGSKAFRICPVIHAVEIFRIHFLSFWLSEWGELEFIVENRPRKGTMAQ